MAERRQHAWQKRKMKSGLCWKCGDPAEPKLNSKGKVIGYRKLCETHLAIDRERTLQAYYRRKNLQAA